MNLKTTGRNLALYIDVEVITRTHKEYK